MFSDVPADGYSIELSQRESVEVRGQIFATCQRIRYTFSIIAGVIQSVLLNSKATNKPSCSVSFDECWTWGLTSNQYYGLLFVIIVVLFNPVCWLTEYDGDGYNIPVHSGSISSKFVQTIQTCLGNSTFLSLLIFSSLGHTLSNILNAATRMIQYYLLGMTGLQVTAQP